MESIQINTILAGHYQILQPLGQGGFGQTLLAKDIHLPGNPVCVVKKLKPKSNDPETLETAKRLFDREAQTLYRLGVHDRIPRLLAHFEQDQEFYLVQDFIAGQPLDRTILPGQPWQQPAVISLLHDILEVLSFVHQQNVIHRDIKPANLIRRSLDGKIVLIDFGAVKEVSTQAVEIEGNTSLTVAIGSPGYMPSEQQAFKPHFSSDIYAVGMVCLQALSGLSLKQLPRDEQGEFSTQAIATITSIHPEFAAMLDKMVRYDYRMRYKNATEALAALNQWVNSADSVADIAELSTILSPIPTASAIKNEPLIEGNLAEISTQTMAATPRKGSSNSSQLKPPNSSRLNPEFLKQCQQELARSIGPMASFVLEDILGQDPQISPQQLVETLAAEIPNPRQAQDFKQHLFPWLT